jgi:hypothetical protein
MSSAVIKEGENILHTFSHEDFLSKAGLFHYFYRPHHPLTLSVEGVLRAEIAEGRDDEIAVSEFKNGEKGFQLIATGIRVLHLGD